MTDREIIQNVTNRLKENKIGRWELDVERSKKHIENIYVCSNCKTFVAWGESEKTNYCPHCGARMEETTLLIDKSALLKTLDEQIRVSIKNDDENMKRFMNQVIEVIRDFPTKTN